MSESKPLGPRGIKPPPFLAKEKPRRGKRGWWAGLNRRGKLYATLAALLAAATLTSLAASSAAGVSRESAGHQGPPRPGAVAAAAAKVSAGASRPRLAVLSLRLHILVSDFKALAPLVREKVKQLSMVVQGGRCSGYLARALELSDASDPSVGRTAGAVPEDPHGAWLYANELADRYTPAFTDMLARARALGRLLGPRRFPAGGRTRLTLDCCGAQARAAEKYIRAFGLLRNCDENTVGQACELMADGDAVLDRAWARLESGPGAGTGTQARGPAPFLEFKPGVRPFDLKGGRLEESGAFKWKP